MSRQSELAELSRVYDSSALSNRNLIINGAMQVAQRGTSFTGLGGATGAVYNLDRFNTFDQATAGRATVTQDTSAPNGFGNSLKIACTTADTSLAAGEMFLLTQRLEGQNLQQFAKGTSEAKEFTVSFYVKGNASATYVCELFHAGASRQISKTFSVTTDWTRVILTYPADTTSAFANDNTGVLYFQIFLHAGSSFTSGTLNSTSWAANTSANRAAGIDSFFDSTSRTFFITGVQLEVGSEATPFEHRSFGDELVRCQRYFNRIGKDDGSNTHLLVGGVEASSTLIMSRACPVSMRAVPTCTMGSGVRGFSAAVGVSTISSFSSRNTRDITCLSVVVSGSHTLGQAAVLFDATSNGYIDSDAEL